MSNKHTPGPWLSHSGCIYAACQMNERGTTCQRPLAEVTSDQDHDDHYEANCRLIAAAPDLLEALLELTARSENFHAADVRFADFEVAKDAIRNARTAIAKATGGAA